MVPGRFIDDHIARQGIAALVRREHPEDDFALYMIDMPMAATRTFRARGRPAFSISLFLEGSGTFRIDGTPPLAFSAGDVLLFHGDQPVAGENHYHAGGRLRCLDMRLSHDRLRRLGLADLQPALAELDGEQCRREGDTLLVALRASRPMLVLAEAIFALSTRPVVERRLLSMAHGIEILAHLAGIVTMDPGGDVPGFNTGDRRRIAHARHLLSQHHADDWTIPLLSQTVGLNQQKLKTGFRQLVGMPPHAFLRRARLLAAEGLLMQGATATEAAIAVGYTNMSHFARIFRECYGCNPSLFRARRHKDAEASGKPG